MDQESLKFDRIPLIDDDAFITCVRAVDVLGVTSQINKAKEELSELHLELDRLQSSPIKTSKENIITEIADVAIMIQQLAIIYGKEKVSMEIATKILRLNDTIDKFVEAKLNK